VQTLDRKLGEVEIGMSRGSRLLSAKKKKKDEPRRSPRGREYETIESGYLPVRATEESFQDLVGRQSAF
jgi:hypothetical protein